MVLKNILRIPRKFPLSNYTQSSSILSSGLVFISYYAYTIQCSDEYYLPDTANVHKISGWRLGTSEINQPVIRKIAEFNECTNIKKLLRSIL